MTDAGVFTVSLDLELAWGSFDRGGVDRHGDAYRRTPEVVARLCDLFDDHDVSATWAIVAHLLSDCEGTHDADARARAEWLASAPCATGVERSLWHAPGLVETVTGSDVEQEVGLHGYSHAVFGDLAREAAAAELSAAVDAAGRAGLDPASFVFPRNEVAHVDLLAEHGFEVYRGRDARWYERGSIPRVGRRPLRFVDEASSSTPPTVVPDVRDGIVRLPGSMAFRPLHGPWRWTPAGSQLRRARKGLQRAAGRGEVFHLWFHPFNLARDPDPLLAALGDVLDHADRLRESGDLEVLTMREVAEEVRAGRWDDGKRSREPGAELEAEP